MLLNSMSLLLCTGTCGPAAARLAILRAQRQLAEDANVHLHIRNFSVSLQRVLNVVLPRPQHVIFAVRKFVCNGLWNMNFTCNVTGSDLARCMHTGN